jgi:hypothetical protein
VVGSGRERSTRTRRDPTSTRSATVRRRRRGWIMPRSLDENASRSDLCVLCDFSGKISPRKFTAEGAEVAEVRIRSRLIDENAHRIHHLSSDLARRSLPLLIEQSRRDPPTRTWRFWPLHLSRVLVERSRPGSNPPLPPTLAILAPWRQTTPRGGHGLLCGTSPRKSHFSTKKCSVRWRRVICSEAFP